MTYDELKAAHAAGAWIYGIEGDGKLHRIEDPQWSCPADRYVALVPYIAELGQEVGAVAYMEPVTCNACSPADFAEALRKWPDDYHDWFPVYRASPAHTSEARDGARWKWLSPRILSADFAGDEFVGLTFELPAGSVVYASAEATIDAAMRQEGGE